MTVNSLVIMILFYAGWFGSIFLAKSPYPEASIVLPLILIALLFFKRLINRTSFLVAALITVVGVLSDSLLVGLGFVQLEGQTGWIIPLWLVSIWLLFAYSMIVLGRFFRWPVWLASLLGFVFGPLSYRSGEYFDVLTPLTPQTFWIYAVFWAILFPVVLRLSKRFS